MKKLYYFKTVVIFITIINTFTIYGQGKVGINNNNPETTLDIDGSLRLREVYVLVPDTNQITVNEITSYIILYPAGINNDFWLNYDHHVEGQVLYVSNKTDFNAMFTGAVRVMPGLTHLLFSDGEWKVIIRSSSAWIKSGNHNTQPNSDFLGTGDSNPLIIKTNNIERMRIGINDVGITGGNSDINTTDGDLKIGSEDTKLKFSMSTAGGGAGVARINSMGGFGAQSLNLGVNGSDNLNINNQGKVGVGTANPHASSIVEIQSTTAGLLPPRMTEAQRDAIAAPAEGLLITCTDCSTTGLQQYINGSWRALSTRTYSVGDIAHGGIVF